MKRALWGGPARCPTGPCSECGPFPPAYDFADLEAFKSAHHFSDAMISFSDDFEEENSEPAKLGHESWYDCKHCPAWVEASAMLDPEDSE